MSLNNNCLTEMEDEEQLVVRLPVFLSTFSMPGNRRRMRHHRREEGLEVTPMQEALEGRKAGRENQRKEKRESATADGHDDKGE